MGSAVEPAGALGLSPAYAAVRARLGLVAALFAVAALGWVWSARAMAGMDAGPWTTLGGLGWFLGTWTVMMAAMMLPSVAPTVALYTRATKTTSPASPWLFAGGYLLTWAAAGLLAYVVAALLGASGETFSWENAGRPVAGATLLVAAAYELTPLKDVCLGKCRSPLAAFLSSWKPGAFGAVRMGARNGAWCVGCCWALMASLFALGIMSVTWMAFVAGLIAFEKTVPSRRSPAYVTAAVLAVVGVMLLVAPEALPGLRIPSGATMSM